MNASRGFPMPTSLSGRALLAVVFMAGCRACGDPPPIEPPVVDRPPVEQRLQVTSIDPSQGKPGEGFPAQIFGSAFAEGARVQIGEVHIDRVVRRNGNTLQVNVPALSEGVYDVVVRNPDGEEARLRQALVIEADDLVAACRHVRVHFDFDSSAITSESRATLDANLDCFRRVTSGIRIEGHTDSRGTIDYNLALGERRAEAVRRYLSNGGVAQGRMQVVSFGKERPLVRAENEEAWAQNRRAELHVAD